MRPARFAAPSSCSARSWSSPHPWAGAASTPGPGQGPDASRGWVPPLDREVADLDVLAPFDPPERDWRSGAPGRRPRAETVRFPRPRRGLVSAPGPSRGATWSSVLLHDDGLDLPRTRDGVARRARDVRVRARHGARPRRAPRGAAAPPRACTGACDAASATSTRCVLLGDRPPIVLLPLGRPARAGRAGRTTAAPRRTTGQRQARRERLLERGAQPLSSSVRVALRRRERGVPEDLLHAAQVRAPARSWAALCRRSWGAT